MRPVFSCTVWQLTQYCSRDAPLEATVGAADAPAPPCSRAAGKLKKPVPTSSMPRHIALTFTILGMFVFPFIGRSTRTLTPGYANP